MTRYTIAVCVFEMAETIERSLDSMLEQVDEQYEVLVVDGGSQDGTVEVLEELEANDERLRVHSLHPDPNRHLGADRQRAIEEANGEYVLVQLDADDVYEPVIQDFVSIYHELERVRDGPFFLSGHGLNVAPKSLLLEIPYRNLKTGEDRDLWRRLYAADSIEWIDHGTIFEEIGYEKSLEDELRRDFNNKVADMQVRVTLSSALRWSLWHPDYYVLEEPRSPVRRVAKAVYDVCTYPMAWYVARQYDQFETPSELRQRGELDRAIYENQKTLAELEQAYSIEIDRDDFSSASIRAFYQQ